MQEQSFSLPPSAKNLLNSLESLTTSFQSSPRLKMKLFMNSSHCESVSASKALSNLANKAGSILDAKVLLRFFPAAIADMLVLYGGLYDAAVLVFASAAAKRDA